MGNYKLTEDAQTQIAEIYRYSVFNFGLPRARRYLRGLHDALELLAENPLLGRAQEDLEPGYRRLAHQSHVIYYQASADEVVIMDIAHYAQDPKHLSES